MTPTQAAKIATAAGKPVTLAVLEDLFGPPSVRPFALRLWDGTLEVPGAGLEPRFTLVLNRPRALRKMLLPPTDLALGEAYLRDDFDVEGTSRKPRSWPISSPHAYARRPFWRARRAYCESYRQTICRRMMAAGLRIT